LNRCLEEVRRVHGIWKSWLCQDDYLEIDYDDFVAHKVETIVEIMEYIGIPRDAYDAEECVESCRLVRTARAETEELIRMMKEPYDPDK
jgi:LPS sulfotransferase NodH